MFCPTFEIFFLIIVHVHVLYAFLAFLSRVYEPQSGDLACLLLVMSGGEKICWSLEGYLQTFKP